MVKVSCCTFIKNAKYNDLPINHWIHQHGPLFDEVIVVDTGSEDGTFKVVSDLANHYENVHSYLIEIEDQGDNKWYRDCKKAAIDVATYNTVLFLDADEFIHEKSAPEVYKTAHIMQENNINGQLKYKQFVGNLFTEVVDTAFGYFYQTRLFRKDRPYKIWQDGGGFFNKDAKGFPCMATIWHYAYVRDPQSLNWKGKIQHSRMFDEENEWLEKRPKDMEKEIDLERLLGGRNRIKIIGDFPKQIRENPLDFFKMVIDPIDEVLLGGKDGEINPNS